MIVRVDDTFQKCFVLEGAVCAFGVFDGLHLGHQYIIEQAQKHARAINAPLVIITFAQDPDEMFNPQGLKKLMSNERRLAQLDAFTSATVLVLPFSKAFFALAPVVFLEKVFGQNVPAALHIGSDFRFGQRASGTIDDLRHWGASRGMEVLGYDLFCYEGEPVTATRIRKLLAENAIKEANKLLGAAFCLEGEVEEGRGEGRDMGFRTANVTIPAQLYSLGEGVYGAYAVTEAGKRYKAAVSVGGAPTFGEASHANIEAHILDFDQDIYGQKLRLEFVEYLRPLMVFPSVDVLIETVMGNIQWCRDNL